MAKVKQMSQSGLAQACEIFLDANHLPEYKLARFRLDIYFPKHNLAFEFDGPDHYDKVRNHERDLRKNELCRQHDIRLIRWPYYFQLTQDVAKYLFDNFYSDNKYRKAVQLVYGTDKEHEILAPGLHESKFTPANFTSPGMKRFLNEMDKAPTSLRSQVIYSFKLYERKIIQDFGKEFLWLLYPEGSPSFDKFMDFIPREEHLNYHYPNS